MYSGQRGVLENKDELFEAMYLVIRMNPVTAWRSIYVVEQHVSHINRLSEDESNNLLDWFLQLVIESSPVRSKLAAERQRCRDLG